MKEILFLFFIQFSKVLGPIEPKELGTTLTHEHIRMDYGSCFIKPPREDHMQKIDGKIELKNLGFVRQYPYVMLIFFTLI